MEAIGEDLFNVVVGGAIFVFFAGIVYLALRGRVPDAATKEAYRRAEMALGLKLKMPRIGYPSLSGTMNGRTVSIQAHPPTAAQTQNRMSFSAASTAYTAVHHNEQMSRLRLAPGISTNEDRKVGDPEFDRKFAVLEGRGDAVRAVFGDTAVQRQIMGLNALVIYINNKRVAVMEQELTHDPEQMRAGLALALALADSVERF